MKKQKGFIQIPLLIVIIAGVLVLGGGGYFKIKQYQNYQIKKEKIATEQKYNEETRNNFQNSEVEKLRQEVEDLKKQQTKDKNTESGYIQKSFKNTTECSGISYYDIKDLNVIVEKVNEIQKLQRDTIKVARTQIVYNILNNSLSDATTNQYAESLVNDQESKLDYEAEKIVGESILELKLGEVLECSDYMKQQITSEEQSRRMKYYNKCLDNNLRISKSGDSYISPVNQENCRQTWLK